MNLKYSLNLLRSKFMSTFTDGIGQSVEIKTSFSLNEPGIKRILIVRPNSRLGNQLMLTPLLQEIEKLVPNPKVDLFVRGNLAPILFQNYKFIDRIIKLPPKPFKQLGTYLNTWLKLKKHRYDLVFNVEMNSSSGRLCTKWVKGKVKFFGKAHEDFSLQDAENMAKWPVYNFQKIASLLGVNSIHDKPQPLNLRLSDDEVNKGKTILHELVGNDKPTIMFYTFATGDKCLSKDWWKPFFALLKEHFGERYNLLEVLPKENISQIDFDSLNYYSRDIREMGAVMHLGKVFVTGDCGIMHLASSVDLPTAALFSRNNIKTYEPYNRGSFAVMSDSITHEELIERIEGILSSEKRH